MSEALPTYRGTTYLGLNNTPQSNFELMAKYKAVTTADEAAAWLRYTENSLSTVKACGVALLLSVPIAGVAYAGKIREWRWLGAAVGGGTIGSLFVHWIIKREQTARREAWNKESEAVVSLYLAILDHIMEGVSPEKIVDHFNKAYTITEGRSVNLSLLKQKEVTANVVICWDEACQSAFATAAKETIDKTLYSGIEGLAQQSFPGRLSLSPGGKTLISMCQLLSSHQVIPERNNTKNGLKKLSIGLEKREAEANSQAQYQLVYCPKRTGTINVD